MTDRENLTRPRRSSISSEDTKTRSSLLKTIKDIFESPKRDLERRQTILNECLVKEQLSPILYHRTKHESKRTSLNALLSPGDFSESDLYESKDNNKYHTCGLDTNAGFQKNNNQTSTDHWRKLDVSISETKGYENQENGRILTNTLDVNTFSDVQAHPLTFETENSFSASDRRNVNPSSETKASLSLKNADLNNDDTFVNIGYSGVDNASDHDADVENITVDRPNRSTGNYENDVLKQRNVPKNWFISLAVINIVLVVFIFLLFFELRQDKRFRNEEIKQILKEYFPLLEGNISSSIYCLPCENIDETISNHFLRSDEDRCCVKDASQVLRLFWRMNDMKTKEYSSRINILEGSQNRVLSDVADLQMKVFDKHDVDKGWPKHPEIQKNNRLINVLLTRRRSAIQLKGMVKNGFLKWSTDMSEGKLTHIENVINLENGGMYVMYSMIRFRKNVCGSDGKIGYAIKHRSDSGPALPITSVYRDCFNEISYDQDLFIQKSFKLSIGQNNDIFLDIGNLEDLIDKDSEHYFGVFELS